MLRAAQERRIDDFDFAACVLDIVQPGQHRFQRDRALQSRQRSTEAEVDAVAEGHMALSVARDVEAFRVRKLAVISVRGGEDRQDDAVLGNRRAGDLYVLSRPAEEKLHGRVIAEGLLDCVRNA